MPRWSKLKKRIIDLICDELKDRIGIYATVYRGTHDQRGKVWIELDKKIIFEANTLEWEIEYFGLSNEIRQINQCTDYTNEKQADGYYQAYNEAEFILAKEHKMDEFQFYKTLNIYLETPYAESMESNDDLIRILCLIDKRLGKRRLSNMVIKQDDCDAVKILYSERCKSMGMCTDK